MVLVQRNFVLSIESDIKSREIFIKKTLFLGIFSLISGETKTATQG